MGKPWTHSRRLSIVTAVLLTAPLVIPASAQPPFVVETIDPGGFVGSYISLAVDDQGRPHAVYWDVSNFWLVYATRTDGVWTPEIIEATGFSGTETSIAVDGDGVPHVSFHNFTIGSEELRYAVRTGGSWTVEDVDATANDVGRYNAIAVDADGVPHIVYHDGTNGDLRYAVKNGGWATEPVATSLTTGLYNDLVLDASGHPHISYINDEPDLQYAHKPGNTWYTDTPTGSASLAPTGIAVDAAGNPTIIFLNGSFLSIATRDGSTGWDWMGMLSSTYFDGAFVLDEDARPQIVFQKTALNVDDLWFIGEADTGWVTSSIIENGVEVDIGQFADLALDPHGNLVAAYFDATHGDAMLVDSGVRLTTALAGATWPVGSERTVKWRGAGTVDLLLSTDGGASYEALATGLTGGDNAGGGTHTFTVPHAPSRFCKIRVERASPFSSSDGDSLFTIETSISLLNFVFDIPDDGNGFVISWQTDPGPEDLAGYRLERERDGSWQTLAPLTAETQFHDTDGRAGDRYRLFAVNGLGESYELATGGPASPQLSGALDAYPNPFTGDALTVRFATAGGLGGGEARATVKVYDVAGRWVTTLVDRAFAAGYQRTTWDGRIADGTLAPAGVYFVKAETGGTVTTRKVTIVR